MKDAYGKTIKSSKLGVWETVYLTHCGHRDGRSGQLRQEGRQFHSQLIDREAGYAQENDRREHERCLDETAAMREQLARVNKRIEEIGKILEQKMPEDSLRQRYSGEEGLSAALIQERRMGDYWRGLTGDPHGSMRLRQELSELRQQSAGHQQVVDDREDLCRFRCDAMAAHTYARIACYITAAIARFRASDTKWESTTPAVLPLTKGVLGLAPVAPESAGATERVLEEEGKGGDCDEKTA